MIVAHIPAGYIVTTGLLKRINSLNKNEYRILFWWGILAGVLPDFDLFYFYLVDNRQHLHHGYWSHLPVYWLITILPVYCYGWLAKKRFIKLIAIFGFININLHLILDSIVGKIRWAYPYSNYDFFMFHVPSQYGWWVWNFIFHWTFLFELALIFHAIRLYKNNN